MPNSFGDGMGGWSSSSNISTPAGLDLPTTPVDPVGPTEVAGGDYSGSGWSDFVHGVGGFFQNVAGSFGSGLGNNLASHVNFASGHNNSSNASNASNAGNPHYMQGQFQQKNNNLMFVVGVGLIAFLTFFVMFKK